jgi:hypothetical protein
MKKIIAISMLAATLAATSAFGQGWIAVSSGNSQVFDGFTTVGVSTRNASNVDIGLFWAAANTANPMAGLLAFTPSTDNSSTYESFTIAQAWSTLLNASGWTLAQSPTIGGPVITTGTTRGAVIFNAGSSFDITGTSGGQDIALLEVGWNAAYADPTAAQTAHSAIGWSYLASVFAFTGSHLGTSGSDPDFAVVGSLPNNFGTFPQIPEPSTIALAGLSSLSLLLFRRRK